MFVPVVSLLFPALAALLIWGTAWALNQPVRRTCAHNQSTWSRRNAWRVLGNLLEGRYCDQRMCRGVKWYQACQKKICTCSKYSESKECSEKESQGIFSGGAIVRSVCAEKCFVAFEHSRIQALNSNIILSDCGDQRLRTGYLHLGTHRPVQADPFSVFVQCHTLHICFLISLQMDFLVGFHLDANQRAESEVKEHENQYERRVKSRRYHPKCSGAFLQALEAFEILTCLKPLVKLCRF
jgi:hypothetical protein